MQQPDGPDSGVRLAEVIASLSIATDLAMGQPLEHALSSCILAVRLGERARIGDAALRDVFYQSLLRFIGCNALTYQMAALFGDELGLRAEFATIDTGRPLDVMGVVLKSIRQANAGASPLSLLQTMVSGIVTGGAFMQSTFAGHCEVAQRLAERLGFGESAITALGQLYERWDGKGLPRGLKGEQIHPAVLIVTLAQDVITFHRLGGVDAAVQMVRDRRSGAYSPELADLFTGQAGDLLAGLSDEPTWAAVLQLEPGDRRYLTEPELDDACLAIADFADIKSPYTVGHSNGVAGLAANAAARCGLPAADVSAIRRAGWLHDVGQVGVSAGIWGKAAPLTERDWEQIRLHSYYTERILARPATFARLGAVASHHHERLDGSGYHRAAAGSALAAGARILAVADAYHAMTEPRPHREARTPAGAAEELRREVRSGRIDPEIVDAVLAAAGHRVKRGRRELVGGLSEREIEVLRLVARGGTIKQIAEALTVAPKTVDNHIQRIYAKIGVSTRAGATLFAMEQDLIRN